MLLVSFYLQLNFGCYCSLNGVVRVVVLVSLGYFFCCSICLTEVSGKKSNTLFGANQLCL